MSLKNCPRAFRGFKRLVALFYGKRETVGLEYLPEEPCVIVGNHAQLHAPLACELYFPGKRKIWCAGQMMEWNEVPAYAFQDFWSRKPRYIRWLFRIASYVITPLAVFLFNNAGTIGVYHDQRILGTFRQTVKALQEGENVVIFPECDVPRNHIVYEFQEHFIDIARLYRKKTGKDLAFVPMYSAPELKKMVLGKPTRFNSEAPREEERRRVCEYLMNEITTLACALPEHKVVPYRNVPKKEYPSNIVDEVENHAQTGC